MGVARERQGRSQDAHDAYVKALEADPKLVRPYVHLAGMEITEGRWAEASGLTDQALKLKPVDYPRAWFYDTLTKLNLNRLKEAESSARQTVASDPQHAFAMADYLLGTMLAKRGEHAEAVEHLRSYLTLDPQGRYADTARKRVDELGRLTQKQ